jgi:hypothetical protein
LALILIELNMKYLILIFLYGLTFNTWGQYCDIKDSNLNAIFICCNSSPKDTSYSFYYYYNINNSIDRVENFKKGELMDITQYIYDSCGIGIKQLIVVPYSIVQFCGDKITKDCLSKIRKYSYRHDTITDLYYIIHGEGKIQPTYDSIFKNFKLIAVLSGTDTLYTYSYDKQNQIIKKYNYSPGSKITSWTKYKYRDNLIIEYDYAPGRKRRPNMITESEINNLDQVIKKTTTYISYRKRVPNDYIIENYSYINGRISMYELIYKKNNACDATYCCNNYKKYFVYKEKN